MIPRLVNTLRDTLRIEGIGRTIKRLKRFGTEREIMDALLWMMAHGEVKREGKHWLALETTTILSNGMEVEIKPQAEPDKRYPVLREELAANGYEHYRNRIIRRIKH